MSDKAVSRISDEEALQLLDGDSELLATLREVFLETRAEIHDGIQSALKARDAVELRRIVHSLKSSSRSIGAIGLSVKAAQLESELIKGNIPTQELQALLEEFLAVLDELGRGSR